MLKNTYTEYGSLAKFFHWLIFLLVFGMIVAGYFMGDITNKLLRSQIVNMHKLTGLMILFLMILRAIWAVANPKPTLPLGTKRVERQLSQGVHFLLYAVLILMPLSGWIMSVASGHPPRFESLFFYLPIHESKWISESALAVHSWVAIAIIGLVSMHVFAALYHHFIKQDDVLKRMWLWKI
ncbi:MAG: cytochrome b [Gammaproteobacteria bacterium]|nr:cytochrome b [Gammaproteobacteria bacterium]